MRGGGVGTIGTCELKIYVEYTWTAQLTGVYRCLPFLVIIHAGTTGNMSSHVRTEIALLAILARCLSDLVLVFARGTNTAVGESIVISSDGIIVGIIRAGNAIFARGLRHLVLVLALAADFTNGSRCLMIAVSAFIIREEK